MYKPYRPQPEKLNYRVNREIKALELRVIDENGQMLGIMSLDAASKLAQDAGLDLIEIVPTATPPVAKIISFDKFRYQKEKELKKQRQAQKISELKGVRISARAAKNDLETWIKKIIKFLEDGHKVEITVILRGREKGNKDWARMKLNEFLQMIPVEYKIIMEPKFGGRGMITQISKK